MSAGDAAVSATEPASGGRDPEETRAGATTFPAAAEARTEDATDYIQGESANQSDVVDS